MGQLWRSGVPTGRRKGVAKSPTAHYMDTWNISRSEWKVMASRELREEKIEAS